MIKSVENGQKVSTRNVCIPATYQITKHVLYHRSVGIKMVASVGNIFLIRSRVVYMSPFPGACVTIASSKYPRLHELKKKKTPWP
jgi:hypothetical protein